MILRNEGIEIELLIGGIKVSYYFICKSKLWLFSHFITQEKESELVLIGKILEEMFFKEIKSKNVLIDTKISIDFIKTKDKVVLHDIKKSSKFKEAHYYQMLYYLWYLKNIKGVEKLEGVINYPKEKKVIKVELTEEKEKEIENILKKINEITSLPKPPPAIYKPYCRKCAYFEFCFGE
jgi:CRISPR-associated exonuclease Cas4